MNKKYIKLFHFLSLVLMIVLYNYSAFGAGAYLSEIGTPGSVGTAGVLNVTNNMDASSAFTQPAGMTALEKDEIRSGMQLLIPTMRFDSSIAQAGGSDGGNAGETAMIPGFFAVKGLRDDLKLGFSLAAALGGGVDYGKRFVGRYQATRSIIEGVAIGPSLGYKVNEKLSVGFGVYALNTTLDQKIALRQFPFSDGEIKFDEIDDWGVQGTIGLTFQLTDKAMLGFRYLSKAEVDLSGDLEFRNIRKPLQNRVTSSLDRMKVDFDFPEAYAIGLMYQCTDNLRLITDFKFERWSQFGDTGISISGGPVPIIDEFDRDWDDAWHLGVAMLYDFGDDNRISMGVSYDSSVVDDHDRTADLPVDEQIRISAGFGKLKERGFAYSFSTTCLYLGDGRIDQTAQNFRYKGKFSTNFIIFAAASLQYIF
jgi:long-chain fatty acid transport protein